MNLNLEATETIVANVAMGLLFIALTPTLLNLILEIGVPDGRGQTAQLGVYIGLTLAGFVLLGMAYAGYRGR